MKKMKLINDYDSCPLKYQFMAEYENLFELEYLAQGPEI